MTPENHGGIVGDIEFGDGDDHFNIKSEATISWEPSPLTLTRRKFDRVWQVRFAAGFGRV